MATTVTLKPNAIDLSGSTSGTTTLQATAVAGTTTITLPAATDTLVGKATTDTLTNKTLTTPVISTISNTGTLTLPTSTDTLVGRATTDTLTNKTLTTPVISSLSSASATALTLQSAGTTAITVDTSQNVAVGNTSPQAKLSVGAGTTAPGFGTASKMLYVCDTTQPEVLIRETSGSVVTSMYSDASTGNLRTATNHPLVLQTNNTERMRINAGAPILCLAGGSTTATGTGIAFPATQSASSDANTLDDYEEGTWSPVIGGSTSTSGQSYSIQVGRYTKIGRQVNISFQATLSNKGTMTGTYAVIQGLPFSAGTDSQTAGNICVYNNMNTGFTFMGFQASSSNSFAYLTGSTGANANTSFLAPADINSSTQLIGSMTYFV